MGVFSIVKEHLQVFKVGFKNLFKPDRMTIMYPDEEPDYGPLTRGWIKLDVKKCTGCAMCARICPTNAIKMYTRPDKKKSPGIDYGRCIMCYFCVDACPADALTRTTIKCLAWYSLTEMKYRPETEVEEPTIETPRPRAVKVSYDSSNGRIIKIRIE